MGSLGELRGPVTTRAPRTLEEMDRLMGYAPPPKKVRPAKGAEMPPAEELGLAPRPLRDPSSRNPPVAPHGPGGINRPITAPLLPLSPRRGPIPDLPRPPPRGAGGRLIDGGR